MKLRKAAAAILSVSVVATTVLGTSVLSFAEDAEPLKVALLLTGSLGDLSFLDSANAGMTEVQEKYNVDVKVIEMGSDSTKYETNFLDASEADYDIIIGSGWMTQEPIQNVAPEFPEKKYIIFDAAVDYANGDYSNVYSINYKQNEASFLAGVLAAKMSETGTIGFIGGAEGGVIADFLVGYLEGAVYANPDIKALVGYVGDFVDSPKCKSLALAQYQQNADYVFTAAGSAGIGSLDAAKEAEKWAIGVDSDQAMLFEETDPDTAARIPTSVIKRVDNSLVQAFDKIEAGEEIWGQEEVLGLAEEAVSLCDNSYYQELIPEELRQELEDVKAKIVSGEITVDSAFGMNTDEVNEMVSSVAP